MSTCISCSLSGGICVASIGKCSQCKKMTPSSSHKYCRECGDELHQCYHCGYDLTKQKDLIPQLRQQLDDETQRYDALYKRMAASNEAAKRFAANIRKRYEDAIALVQ